MITEALVGKSAHAYNSQESDEMSSSGSGGFLFSVLVCFCVWKLCNFKFEMTHSETRLQMVRDNVFI